MVLIFAPSSSKAKVFLVHGENEALDELGAKINEEYGFDCAIPQMNQEFEL